MKILAAVLFALSLRQSVSIHLHDPLADGLHMARFVEKFQHWKAS